MQDKTSVIFGNIIDEKTIRNAAKQQQKFLKKFGDDRNTKYHLAAIDNPVLTPAMGVKVLVLSDNPLQKLPQKSIIIGNIRMLFFTISQIFYWRKRNEEIFSRIFRHSGAYSIWMRLSSTFWWH